MKYAQDKHFICVLQKKKKYVTYSKLFSHQHMIIFYLKIVLLYITEATVTVIRIRLTVASILLIFIISTPLTSD